MYIARVLVGMLVMGALDVPVIKFIISPTLSKYAKELVAPRPDALAAVLFYTMYVSVVVYLTHRFATTLKETAILGALLGLLAYGTYELTNKAVIKGWPWQMVAVDLSWGVILTAAVACAVFILF